MTRNLINKKKVLAKREIKKKPIAKRKIKKSPVSTLTKPVKNPIISPKPENKWESWQTFNPGVTLLDDKVHFLYRAIGEDGMSRIGYASSSCGFELDKRTSYPVYEHSTTPLNPYSFLSLASGGSWGGCEDPRINKIKGEDNLYITYTACDEGLRIGLTSIKIKDFLNGKWKWSPPKLISPPGEIHKNWVIFPEKIKGKYAILHSINPKISIAYVDNLEFKGGGHINSHYGDKNRKKDWDTKVRGIGPPPIKTKHGWLIFYHAIDKKDPGRYKIGAMLLDLKNPTKILCRSKNPLLEPDEDYENNGFKKGIVYASGAIVKNGNLIIYYGGSDSYVCVAKVNLEKFLQTLKEKIKPAFKKRVLNKKLKRK